MIEPQWRPDEDEEKEDALTELGKQLKEFSKNVDPSQIAMLPKLAREALMDNLSASPLSKVKSFAPESGYVEKVFWDNNKAPFYLCFDDMCILIRAIDLRINAADQRRFLEMQPMYSDGMVWLLGQEEKLARQKPFVIIQGEYYSTYVRKIIYNGIVECQGLDKKTDKSKHWFPMTTKFAALQELGAIR